MNGWNGDGFTESKFPKLNWGQSALLIFRFVGTQNYFARRVSQHIRYVTIPGCDSFRCIDNENNNIGFGSLEISGEEDRAMRDFFKPELRNRIDQICKFTKLDTLAIKKIVVKFLDELQSSLGAKNIRLSCSEQLIQHLADVGYDSKMGARPLSRKIDELIRVPLSKKILFEQIKNATINATMIGDEIEFVANQKLTAEVGEDGIIKVSW